MMKTRRMSILGLLAMFVMSVLVGLVSIAPAQASVKGRRNTALGLSGLAAYELLRGHTGTGLLVGAGAAYAWKRTNDAKKAERRHHYRSTRRHRSADYRR